MACHEDRLLADDSHEPANLIFSEVEEEEEGEEEEEEEEENRMSFTTILLSASGFNYLQNLS